MNTKLAGCAIALAAAFSGSAFAQTAIVSATGPVVTSGTGIVVTPGVPKLAPNTDVYGYAASTVQASQTTTVAGNTTTTTRTYWVNVPSDVTRDDRFQRWQGLR